VASPPAAPSGEDEPSGELSGEELSGDELSTPPASSPPVAVGMQTFVVKLPLASSSNSLHVDPDPHPCAAADGSQ
jgi:hypothetical protein